MFFKRIIVVRDDTTGTKVNRFVVDCSVTAAWCFQDEQNDYVDTVLDALQTFHGIVPPIWLLEMVNVFLVAERRNRLKEAETFHFFHLLESLPIEIYSSTRKQEGEILLTTGRKYSLSSYDAAYLYLAMQENCPLATQDGKLKKACKNAGVALFMEGC